MDMALGKNTGMGYKNYKNLLIHKYDKIYSYKQKYYFIKIQDRDTLM